MLGMAIGRGNTFTNYRGIKALCTMIVVYAADLRKNPGNGYSLFGLKLSLEQQGKIEDARAVTQRFNRAWADAPHELTSSRF